MGLLARVRARWRRLSWGIDEGDLVPGFERVHLSGRALRRAIRRGEVNPDGTTRTRRSSGPRGS